jgi:hypothetical protein
MRICPVTGRLSPDLAAALAAQSGDLTGPAVDERLRAALERALASGADWLWVIDGTAVPRPGALAALAAARDRLGDLPPPVLLTGLVVGADGRAHPRRGPWYHRFGIDLALLAADRGVVPVRGSRGPMLVRRDAAAAALPRPGAPFTAAAVLEWSALLLRPDRGAGYLVPESESVGEARAGDPMRGPGTVARLLLGRALRRLDRVALLLELAEQAGVRRDASEGPRRAP